MTRREALALVVDERDCLGDETTNMGEMDADLAFQMRTSIRFVLVEKRVTELERQLEAQRSLVNKMLARWLVLGYPALTEDGV